MQFIPDQQGTYMEWSFEGVMCHGFFKPETSVAILNFCLQEAMVTITYRVLDANTSTPQRFNMETCLYRVPVNGNCVESRHDLYSFSAAPGTGLIRPSMSTKSRTRERDVASPSLC
ncbi:hypothetical protein PsorP6_003429 [Peronosclerospora sorghi]|uniref:Uncharacterized protein n=1 Tax=Peronosclerospora sorghi TaxID=230839 RepID=A0ACC0VKE7_9STRA|nr:hypothetical protein PsorP6_003429 [Peronosclerospora sorghi]